MTAINALIQELNNSYTRLTHRLTQVTPYTTAGDLRPELEDLEKCLGSLRRQLAIFPEEVLDVDRVETSSPELDALTAMTIPAKLNVFFDVNLYPDELDDSNHFVTRLKDARGTFVWSPAINAGVVDLTDALRDIINN